MDKVMAGLILSNIQENPVRVYNETPEWKINNIYENMISGILYDNNIKNKKQNKYKSFIKLPEATPRTVNINLRDIEQKIENEEGWSSPVLETFDENQSSFYKDMVHFIYRSFPINCIYEENLGSTSRIVRNIRYNQNLFRNLIKSCPYSKPMPFCDILQQKRNKTFNFTVRLRGEGLSSGRWSPCTSELLKYGFKVIKGI